jgi:hypothetical protein
MKKALWQWRSRGVEDAERFAGKRFEPPGVAAEALPGQDDAKVAEGRGETKSAFGAVLSRCMGRRAGTPTLFDEMRIANRTGWIV